MSEAFELGRTLKQAGVLSRTGELATLLLNRLSGRGRLGHQLLNAGSADRIQLMKKRHLAPMTKARPGSQLGERLAGRTAKFEQIAGHARNSRLEDIGAGTLGLGAAGGLMAANQLDQP